MRKTHPTSPRLQLWMAGLLILAGTLVLVQTAWYPVAFYLDPREQTTWHTTADRTYAGVLSATNESVLIPLTDATDWTELRLSQLWSNDTPITLTLRDWNDSIVLQLVNYTPGEVPHWCEIIVQGGLGAFYSDTATLAVARVSADVRFAFHLVLGYWIPALPSAPSYALVILGYALGVALIGSGFGLIEGVVRAIKQGRL